MGAVATQGCNWSQRFVRTYTLQYSQDGTTWTTYSDNFGSGEKIFQGNYDQDTVQTNRFARPFLARFIRVVPLEWNNDLPCLRLELYADPNEEWVGGQPLGITNGRIADSQLSGSGVYANNWDYYGPRNGRLYNRNNYGSYYMNDGVGAWAQVDLGKEREIGAIATQGAYNAPYGILSYYLSYSIDGTTWKSYTEGGMRKLLVGNPPYPYENVRKNTLASPFVARYIRLIVNEQSSYNMLRWELYAPEHKKFRLGVSLGLEVSGRLPDRAFSSSTIYNNNYSYYGPQNSRLNNRQNYQAFVPGSYTDGQWISVDLGAPLAVGGIATQGRNVNNDVGWVKSYSLEYSLNNSEWVAYMSKGSKVVFQGNTDGHSVASHVFDVPFVARYVRVTFHTWHTRPDFRWDLYAPHESRLNSGKLESLGNPLGMTNGDIKDSQLSASTEHDANHGPAFGRLLKSGGAGAWCAVGSKMRGGDQWIQIETSGTVPIGGVATQGRASATCNSCNQWVTQYRVLYSDDGKSWSTVKDENGEDRYFTANTDTDTVVKHAFATPFKAKFVRINPTGFHNHMSMRVELYDTAEYQATLLAQRIAEEKAKAEADLKAKQELEARQAKEKAEREAREAAEKAAKEKADEERRVAEHDAAMAKNDADRKAAAEALQKAKVDQADAAKALADLEQKAAAERAKHKEERAAIQDRIAIANGLLEDEKFDENQLSEAEKKIATAEEDIAAEKTKQNEAKVAWGEKEMILDEDKKAILETKNRIAAINKMLAEDKAEAERLSKLRQDEIAKEGGVDTTSDASVKVTKA